MTHRSMTKRSMQVDDTQVVHMVDDTQADDKQGQVSTSPGPTAE
jgi:hypothetical protein